jgi:hypothetical protein
MNLNRRILLTSFVHSRSLNCSAEWRPVTRLPSYAGRVSSKEWLKLSASSLACCGSHKLDSVLYENGYIYHPL